MLMKEVLTDICLPRSIRECQAWLVVHTHNLSLQEVERTLF